MKKIKRYDMHAISGHVQEAEHPLGSWVRWDDVIEEILKENEILKVQDVPECNCEDGMDLWQERWVCPKHGYKKR